MKRKSVAEEKPELVAQWARSNPISPDKVSCGSHLKVRWVCAKGHEWEAMINSRKRNGCPYCSGKAVLKGYNDLATTHPDLANEWHPSRNGDKITLSLNPDGRDYIVSSSYITFDVKNSDVILPEFLYLWFCRPEFDRYARFNSWGSAREAFSFEDMKRTVVPLPPLDVQRAIVNIYKCANEAKQIAAEADRLSREICPALLQHVIHN